jgi:hypothetical protein
VRELQPANADPAIFLQLGVGKLSKATDVSEMHPENATTSINATEFGMVIEVKAQPEYAKLGILIEPNGSEKFFNFEHPLNIPVLRDNRDGGILNIVILVQFLNALAPIPTT